MHNHPKTFDELLKEQEELKRDYESLKTKYNQVVTQYNQAESDLVSLEKKFQSSFDSTNNAVALLNKQYRLLVDSANEAIVVVQGGMVRLTNPMTRTMTGYSEEEIKAIPFELFIHPEDRAKVVDNHQRRLQGEDVPSYYIFRLLNKDGSTRWVYMNAVLIDWEGCPATLNFLTDITELKLTEEALQQSSQKWEAVISASPDGIGMISLDGKIQLISEKLVAMHGFNVNQVDEYLGKSIFEFIDPADHKLLIENTRKLLAGENGNRLTEYRAIKKDHTGFDIDVNASILLDSNGKPTSILYVERDITERKLAETVIQKSNQEFEKLNSEKDKLFSIIAHDLRSPFNNLLGLTEILETDGHKMSSAEITRHSNSLHRSAVTLYTLLENLLEWALFQKDSIGFAPEYHCLAALFSQSKDPFEQKALQKGITILNEIPDNLEIYADEKMIKSVLRNLMSNALKFTKKGGKIVGKARKIGGEFVEISVTDNGVGIPGNIIAKLFNLGEKVGSRGTDNEPSTGLGLVLCKEFIEKNGGQIWVESREYIGSTFYFTLPLIAPISQG